MSPSAKPPLAIHPLTLDRWDDFETLFGKNGGCAGCWCMWPRMGQTEWHAKKPVETKERELTKRAERLKVNCGTVLRTRINIDDFAL